MTKTPASVSEYLAEIGAKGGAAGKGKARGFAKLTPKQRKQLAADAARARWEKEKAS
jgi:hypothetical protein